MRLLSALNNGDIDEFLKSLPGIKAIEIVNDKKSLLDALSFCKYDLVLLSREFLGNEDIGCMIELLRTKEFNNLRIIYLYGEYDNKCGDAVRILFTQGIYDFFVGDEITSKDIERLIFNPASKETAYSYCKSHFNNEQCFSNRKLNKIKRKHFLGSTSLLSSIFKPILKAKDYESTNFEKLIISVISNQATGKSHTAWNLSYCLSKHGYSTSLINIDRGYSANLYFAIDEIYYNLLDFTIQNNKHKDILDNCFKWKSLNVITGKLGEEKEIDDTDFSELLYSVRTKSDITVIDTRTGLTALTRLSVKSSTYDLMIFDCDIMHFHLNMSMLEDLKDDFVPEKTIAVINNTNVKSSSHKFIYNELINSGIPFKEIACISSCGILSCERMHTGLTPYQVMKEENSSFVSDIDNLLYKLSVHS